MSNPDDISKQEILVHFNQQTQSHIKHIQDQVEELEVKKRLRVVGGGCFLLNSGEICSCLSLPPHSFPPFPHFI